MKDFKNKIFNFKKHLPIIIILVLFVSVLILALIDFSNIKIGQAKYCSDCQEKENVETEYISQNMTCSKCYCEQAGKKIFSFYGTEADCENMKTEKDRSACYAKHSLKEQTCGHIADNNSKRECLDRFTSMTYKYYLGPGGTLVNQNNVTIKGDTTVLNGFDQYGEHKLMTGVDEGRDLFITFRRKSGDVEFNNNLFVPGDLRINSAYGGVYFGSELVFDNMVYENGDLSSWKNPPRFTEASEPPFSSPTTHDDDGDGVNNRDDNCRDDPNPGQQDYDGDGIGDVCDSMTGFPPGPLDSDGDGYPDVYDNCPTTSNISQLDTDSDGIGDACDVTPGNPVLVDTDGDGVIDAEDNCLDDYNPLQEDSDGDGIGDVCESTTPPPLVNQLDIDGDGVPNNNDNCPNAFNPGQEDSDGNGIGDICEGNPVCTDGDGDGYFLELGCGSSIDCDDTNDMIHPNSTAKSCDKIDMDCNGSFDQINGEWEIIDIPTDFNTVDAVCKNAVDQSGQIACTDNPEAYRAYWGTIAPPNDYKIGSCVHVRPSTGNGSAVYYNQIPSSAPGVCWVGDCVLINSFNNNVSVTYVRDVWYR